MAIKIIRKTIRLTPEENSELISKSSAHGLTFSDYMRDALFAHKIKSKIDIDAIKELKRIGVNLNQIAKRVNMDDISAKELLLKLSDIEISMNDMRQEVLKK